MYLRVLHTYLKFFSLDDIFFPSFPFSLVIISRLLDDCAIYLDYADYLAT